MFPQQLLAVGVLAELKAGDTFPSFCQGRAHAKSCCGSSESNICSKSDALPAELRSPPSRDCRESNIILANVHTSNEILILLCPNCSKCYKYQ